MALINSTLNIEFCVDSSNSSYFGGGSYYFDNYIATVGSIANRWISRFESVDQAL
jgi:hypothetical protein